MSTFSRTFLGDTSRCSAARRAVEAVVDVRLTGAGGRLFLCGSGGGAGHASHAACDFRKLCTRVVRGHRQRLGAHRPHQRRRMGQVLLRLAAGLAACDATACSCSRSAAATSSGASA